MRAAASPSWPSGSGPSRLCATGQRRDAGDFWRAFGERWKYRSVPGLPVLRRSPLGSHRICLQVCKNGVTYAPEAKGDMPVRPAFRMVGALVGVTALGGCAHHPVDCAVGFAWADCLPGTAGYTNGVGGQAVSRDDTQCRSYGLTYGTGDYAQCRATLDVQHGAAARAALGTPAPASQNDR